MTQCRHVVKFADGAYLSANLHYGSRVRQQRFAARWLTLDEAKATAELDRFSGTGARAVRIVYRERA